MDVRGLEFLDIFANLYRDSLGDGTHQSSYPDIRAQLGSTPSKTIFAINKMRLLSYERATPATQTVPILLVPSMINRAYIMDLVPGFSVVEHLLEEGFDVYLLDWGAPSDEDRDIGFDDLINPMLDRVVRAALRHSGAPKLSLVGYCQGAVLGSIYTALYPEHIASFVNLLGPIDFRCAGLFSVWTDDKRFDPERVVAAYGNVPPALMQSAFLGMKPVQQFLKAVKTPPTDVTDELKKFFAALEYWAWDTIPFPGRAYIKYIRDLYQQNRLIEGRLAIHGERVDLAQIHCPVLVLAADKDHIVPMDAATALKSYVGSQRVETASVKGGHVAAVVGPNGREQLWPILSQWLAAV